MRLKNRVGNYIEVPGEDYHMTMLMGLNSRVAYVDSNLGTHNNPIDSLSMQDRNCVLEANVITKKLYSESKKWSLDKIPKIANFYWGSSKMSFMRYMTIKSFRKHNPDWSVHLYTPQHISTGTTWRKFDNHHQNDSSDYKSEEDYFSQLLSEEPIKIIKVDFSKTVIGSSASEPHKSDFLRWNVLYQKGGLWSDMDIVYHKSMNDLYFNNYENSQTDLIVSYDERHIENGVNLTPIGFLITKPKNSFFNSLAKKWSRISMLAFTHGQPASPTTLGKEFSNFTSRIKFNKEMISSIKQKGKFNGASGNYNAHVIAQKNFNWENLSKKFVSSLGLNFSSHSTQIELKDAMASQLGNIHNLNNVLIDFSQDIWLLISKNYLKQNLKSGEVGSSTMPHKVNPIDFENAEGNLSMANGLLIAIKNKIQISRLQRDLSDSTVLRNIGALFAYIFISLSSLEKGINKILPNKEKMSADLDNSWEILTEAIQTILRKNGYEDSYNKIKSISRGKKLDYQSYIKIIDDLKINKADKELLSKLTPKKYIGLAEKLAKSSF